MQFLFYLLVQLLAYGLEIAIFFFLTIGQQFQPTTAQITCKLGAGAFGFFMHHNVTFYSRSEASQVWSAARYCLILGFNIPLSTWILKHLLEVIPSVGLSKFIADVACVVITYLFVKKYVFSTSSTKKRI